MARFHFQGYFWRNATQNTYFVVGILTCFALLACVLLGARARWIRDERKAIWRRKAYVLSTVAVLLHVLIGVVNVGLAEGLRTDSIDGRYYILQVFDLMFSQISDFSILVIMVWTVHLMLFGNVQSHAPSGAIRGLTTVGFTIVGVLSIINWALYTFLINYFISGTPFSYTLVNTQTGIEVAYMAAFTTCSILLSIMAGFAVAREQSRASMLMLFAALLLALRAVFVLANIAVVAYSYSGSYYAVLNLNWAASFVYAFATIGVYACVGIVGNLSPDELSKEGHAYTYEPHYKKKQREI